MSITPHNGTSLAGTDIRADDFTPTLRNAILAEVVRRDAASPPTTQYIGNTCSNQTDFVPPPFVVPAGVTQMTITKVVAPGGTGGTGDLVGNVNTGVLGGGGGGGAWIRDVVLTVVPGDTFAISVGFVGPISSYTRSYFCSACICSGDQTRRRHTRIHATVGSLVGFLDLEVEGGSAGGFCQGSGDHFPCLPAGFGSRGAVTNTLGINGGTSGTGTDGGGVNQPNGGASINGIPGNYGGNANFPGGGGPGGCGYANGACATQFNPGGLGLVEIFVPNLYDTLASTLPIINAGDPIDHITYNQYMAILNALNTKLTASIFATIPQPTAPTITGDTNGNTIITNVSSTTDLQPGMRISGTDIAPNTLIKSITGPFSFTITIAATGSTPGVSFTIPRQLAGEPDPGTNTTNLFAAINALSVQMLP